MKDNLIPADVKESLSLVDLYHGEVIPKGCYDNVAAIVMFSGEFHKRYPGIKVAYGGVQIFPDKEGYEGLYAKHAFFIFNGQALDPTLAAQGKLKQTTHFLPLVVYEIESYVELLSTYGETSPLTVMNQMDNAQEEMMKADMVLVG